MKINLTKNLIKSCTCGNQDLFEEEMVHLVPILTCKKCGVAHQILPGWNLEKLNNFYAYDYHTSYMNQTGYKRYSERYDHDYNVAKQRLSNYKNFIKTKSKGLDIGSSNSAFVHCARDQGYDCIGLEPGTGMGDDAVTIRGTLESVQLENENFDWLTMHDSLEHMVDVKIALDKISKLLKKGGYAIIDLPDFWADTGKHHWKMVEHLWFHTRNQMIDLLEQHSLKVAEVRYPVPGKMVFYAVKV